MTKSRTTKTSELIYLIAGKEESVVNIACDKLLDKLLTPEQRTTALFNADPADLTITDIFDELRTLPFLADKRVVLIKRADKIVSLHRPLFEKYFDNPCPTGTLILTVSTWPANTKLAKKLPKVGKLISITTPKPWQLPARLIQYATDAHGKNLTKASADLLIALAGDDLARLYSEIDKLALYANDAKTITPEHIEKLIGHNRIFNAFEIIDAVIVGNKAAAIDRLRKMFAEDKSTEFTVVGAFAFQFRKMFNAKALLEKGLNPGQVVGKLRIFGKKDAFFAQLRKMSLRQIGDCIEQLAATDYAIKTGQTKARVAIEQLVLKLAAK